MKVNMTLTVAAVVAAVAVPTAEAASVSQLVKQAHGKPYACDVDHDGAWGRKQVQCVIIVVMPAKWERWALRVGKCESNYVPTVVNPRSGASGVFQFMPSTWKNTPQYKAIRRKSGVGRATRAVMNPVPNTEGAKWLVSTSGPSQWSCK